MDIWKPMVVDGIALLKYFWDEERVLAELPANAAKSTQAILSPTLIFYLNKRGIEDLVARLIETPEVRERWYGSPMPEGQGYLTEKELHYIDSLDENCATDTQKAALKFGIGEHVSATKDNVRYLRLVELLFQRRKLKFVFATTSLAFGINMPASNAVFLCYSDHLDSLTFRQCAGRAGRRGFGNNEGRIYFYGFSDMTITRRMCRPLEDLEPSLSISPSYILRCTGLASHTAVRTSYLVIYFYLALSYLLTYLFANVCM